MFKIRFLKGVLNFFTTFQPLFDPIRVSEDESFQFQLILRLVYVHVHPVGEEFQQLQKFSPLVRKVNARDPGLGVFR